MLSTELFRSTPSSRSLPISRISELIEVWSWQAEQEEMKDIDREAHMGMMLMV